jgi:hypothetical protein
MTPLYKKIKKKTHKINPEIDPTFSDPSRIPQLNLLEISN